MGTGVEQDLWSLLVWGTALCGAVFVPLRFWHRRRPPMRWWELKAGLPVKDGTLEARTLAAVLPAFWAVRTVDEGADGCRMWVGCRRFRGSEEVEPALRAAALAAGCEIAGSDGPLVHPASEWWLTVPAPTEVPEHTSDREASDAADLHGFADFTVSVMAGGGTAALLVKLAGEPKTASAAMAATSKGLSESWAATTPHAATAGWARSVPRGLMSDAGFLIAFAGTVLAAGSLATAVTGGVWTIPRTALSAAAAAAWCWFLWSEWQHPSWQRQAASSGAFRTKTTGGLPLPSVLRWIGSSSREPERVPRRTVPAELANDTEGSVRLGFDPAGTAVRLAAADRCYGMFVQGSPGSGKSTLLLAAAAEDIRRRLEGDHRGVLWIETKGEGAARFREAAERCQARIWEFRAAASSPESASPHRLELIDWADPEGSAALLTNALVYAFDSESIRDHSRAVLAAALAAAIAMPADAAKFLGWETGKPNVVHVGWELLGGGADTGREERARHVVERACPQQWSRLSGYMPRAGKSKAEAEKGMAAPRNKLESLLDADGLFAPDRRPTTTLSDLVNGHEIALFDLAPERTEAGGSYDSVTAERLAGVVMFCLHEVIAGECGTWGADQRATAVYSDELSNIAGAGEGSSVVQEIADQGRSRGVWAMFGTQDPLQLGAGTRRGVASFNRVTYRMISGQAAREAEAEIDHADFGFTSRAIQYLPVGDGVARLFSAGQLQPPFMLRAPAEP